MASQASACWVPSATWRESIRHAQSIAGHTLSTQILAGKIANETKRLASSAVGSDPRISRHCLKTLREPCSTKRENGRANGCLSEMGISRRTEPHWANFSAPSKATVGPGSVAPIIGRDGFSTHKRTSAAGREGGEGNCLPFKFPNARRPLRAMCADTYMPSLGIIIILLVATSSSGQHRVVARPLYWRSAWTARGLPRFL